MTCKHPIMDEAQKAISPITLAKHRFTNENENENVNENENGNMNENGNFP